MNDRPDLTAYTNGTANPARRLGPPPENQRDPVDPVTAPTLTPTPPATPPASPQPAFSRPAGRLAAQPTVQLNTRISLDARDQLNELVTDWSGGQPTIRNVIEDLIAAAHAQRLAS